VVTAADRAAATLRREAFSKEDVKTNGCFHILFFACCAGF